MARPSAVSRAWMTEIFNVHRTAQEQFAFQKSKTVTPEFERFDPVRVSRERGAVWLTASAVITCDAAETRVSVPEEMLQLTVWAVQPASFSVAESPPPASPVCPLRFRSGVRNSSRRSFGWYPAGSLICTGFPMEMTFQSSSYSLFPNHGLGTTVPLATVESEYQELESPPAVLPVSVPGFAAEIPARASSMALEAL